MINKLFVIIFLVIPFLGVGQNNTVDIPRDTSFTVWSAGQKLKKDFPNAEAVKEFTGLQIQGEKDIVYY